MPLVVVTGGAGFIGSHVAELLASRGYTVVVVDNFYSGSPGNLASAPRDRVLTVEVDVSDWGSLWCRVSSAVRPGEVHGIVHLAALVSVVEVAENPQRAVDVNVKGTLNVLELARRLDAERVVYASSVAVYGEPRYLPLDERHPLEPSNLYGETKLGGERLLWLYGRVYGLRPAALRLFNVYGPRMRPGRYAGVVYSFIRALLGGRQPVIYGDGKQTRDFVYVEDVAEAFAKALEASYVGPLNIGTGRETSVIQLYEALCRLAGDSCPQPRHAPPRPGDVRRSVADVRLAREKIGWTPKTSLGEGLKRTLEYYRKVGFPASRPGSQPWG